jgi:hypothetical protein
MALAPRGVLAGGKLRISQEEEKRRQTGEKGRTNFFPDWVRNEKENRFLKHLKRSLQRSEVNISPLAVFCLRIVFF